MRRARLDNDAPFVLADLKRSITVNRNVRPRRCRVRPASSSITARCMHTRQRTLDRHIEQKVGNSMSPKLLAAEAAKDLCNEEHNPCHSTYHRLAHRRDLMTLNAVSNRELGW
ncbi:hypothetical protein BD311DRAFT_703519, partial [Dichomitus squalens]